MQILDTFNCVDIHGKKWLVADMRLACDSAEHGGYRALASVGILVFPVGVPLAFLALMWRHWVRGHASTPGPRVVSSAIGLSHREVDRSARVRFTPLVGPMDARYRSCPTTRTCGWCA